VTDFFSAGGCRVDVEYIFNMTLLYQMSQDRLGHGGTADIAVAYE